MNRERSNYLASYKIYIFVNEFIDIVVKNRIAFSKKKTSN
jgi:hypothetical protein